VDDAAGGLDVCLQLLEELREPGENIVG